MQTSQHISISNACLNSTGKNRFFYFIILLFFHLKFPNIGLSQTLSDGYIKVDDFSYGGVNVDELIGNCRDSLGYFYTFGSIYASSPPKLITSQFGEYDYSVVKYDRHGNKIWDQSYGGSQTDRLYRYLPTSNGFMLCGISYSSNSGNKTGSLSCATPFPSSLVVPPHVGWIVNIDTAGHILGQQEICCSFSGSGVGAGPVYVDSITDFIRLKSGQYILSGNFVNYGGYDNTKKQPFVNLITGYIRYDSLFQEIGSCVFSHIIYYPNGADVLNSFQISSSAGNVVPLDDGSLMACWTYKSTFAQAGCGNSSANYFSYANTLHVSAADQPLGFYTYGSQTGNCIAKYLALYGNYLYLFSEHLPLPKSNINYPSTCLGTNFYNRTAPAKADSGNRDCWVVQFSQANTPIQDWAFGAGSDWRFGAVQFSGDSLLLLAGTTSGSNQYDKHTLTKGGKDYWLLAISPKTMSTLYDLDQGGTSDDWLSGFSYYGDALFLSGSSYSDKGYDKTSVNLGGNTLYTDQWTTVLSHKPIPPKIAKTGTNGIQLGCPGSTIVISLLQVNPGITYNWATNKNFSNAIDSVHYKFQFGPAGSALTLYVQSSNGYLNSAYDSIVLQSAKIPNQPVLINNPVFCSLDTLKLNLIADSVKFPANYHSYVTWVDSTSTGIKQLASSNENLTYSINPNNLTHYFNVFRFDSVFYPLSNIPASTCYSKSSYWTEIPHLPPAPLVNYANNYCSYQNPISLKIINDSNLNTYWYHHGQLIATGQYLSYYRTAKSDTLQLIAKDNYNCPSTTSLLPLNQEIIPFRLASTDSNIVSGSPLQFYLTGDSAKSCFWNFGDGSTSYDLSPWHFYNQIGIYSPEVVLTDYNGCIDTIIAQDLIHVKNTIGIANVFKSDHYQVNPNPFQDELFLQSTDNSDFPVDYTLLSMQGLPLLIGTLHQPGLILTDKIPMGIYLFRLSHESPSGTITETIKLVKQ